MAAAVAATTPSAARLGAVNCVADETAGWLGDNTDGAGLVAALARGDGFVPGRGAVPGGRGRRSGPGRRRRPGGRRGRGGDRGQPHRRAGRGRRRAGRPGRTGGHRRTRPGGCDLVVNATPAGMADVPRPVRPAGRSTRTCSARASWSWTSSTTRPARPGWSPRPSRGRGPATAWACSSTRPPSRSSGGPAGRPRSTPCGRGGRPTPAG